MTAGALWRPREGHPPSIDVAVWNSLVSHLGVDLRIGPKHTCRFDAAEAPRPDVAAARLRLASGQTVVAAPVAFPFMAAHGADLTVADLSVLPPALRDALTEGIVAQVAAVMPLSTPPEIVALGLLSELGEAGERPWFRATVGGIASEPVVTDLAASTADLRAVFAGAPLRRVRDALAARLDRPVDATLARMRVAIGVLGAWREGTVVVLDGPAEGRGLRLRAGGRRFDFRARDGAWLCEGAQDAGAEERSAMVAQGERHERSAVDLGAIEVDVDFDLGRTSVPLGEIEGWQPGSLVRLPEALTGEAVAVTLRVNGRAVGSGDIVTIDGRLAVRLSTVAV